MLIKKKYLAFTLNFNLDFWVGVL